MAFSFDIRPGEGVGPLVLGMSRDDVRGLLGAPDREDVETHPDGVSTASRTYEALGLETDFSSDDGDRLGSITVAAPGATLRGLPLIGRTEDDFLAAAAAAGLGPITRDDEFPEVGARDYLWERVNLSFWVMDGQLQSITVMPLYDRTGNVPQWPVR